MDNVYGIVEMQQFFFFWKQQSNEPQLLRIEADAEIKSIQRLKIKPKMDLTYFTYLYAFISCDNLSD